jgi:DnaK suppressor protein
MTPPEAKEPPIPPEQARDLLRRERERIEASMGELGREHEGELEELAEDTDPSEEGEHIEEGQVDDALERKLRAELEAVERAEKRLEEGTYGFSVESGEPIPAPRLETIPWAERTAEEQERYQRSHGEPW